MKKAFSLVLIFLTFFSVFNCFFGNIFAIEALNPKYGITNATVNFRSIPSTTSNIVRTLPKGTKLKILGSLNDFNIVQLSTNEIGVVHSDYISSSSTAPSGSLTYTNIGLKTATVNTDSVNFRRGPGTSFSSITKLASQTKLYVIGSVNGWYVCVTSNNIVGCVYKPYLNLTNNSNSIQNNNENSLFEDTSINTVLNIINEARKKAGVNPLQLGATLPKIAILKAEDMVNNSYFAHNSPTYGSPFNMMENYGIQYNAAGENIAGNPNISAAVKSWLASDTHKQNLLSPSYKYIGIGIVKSDIYGYVIVAMFVG